MLKPDTHLKRILFVGMPFSIHTVRWLNLLKNENWEIHFFSSFPYAVPHNEFPQVFYYDFFYNVKKDYPNLKYRDFSNRKIFLRSKIISWIGKAYRFLGLQKNYQQYFNKIILKIQPDIIHSMESQHAGYLVSNFYKTYSQLSHTPIWIHSTWGLDIDYFQHFPEHLQKLKEMFSNIDIYLAEGQRDIAYARGLGYTKKVLVFPSVAGGYEIEKYPYNKITTSARRKILIKGEQDSVRRGLVALRGLVKCKQVLNGYEVVVYSAAKEVKDYVQYINSKEQLNIQIFKGGSYDDWMNLLADARISVNNNLSDGNPSSLFEAMLMGVFPIQSQNSCAQEWVEDKVTAIFTSAEEPDTISEAIKVAVNNDKLVDEAAKINHEKIAAGLHFNKIQKEAVAMYSDALQLNRSN